jgi:hypothetical protein
MIGMGLGREGLQYTPAEGALTRLGITARHLERVGSQVVMEVGEVMAALTPEATKKTIESKGD